ncbi:MAG: AAA-like domain-containing protein [Bacteroidia bacterium]|nr:AAA-like domain-containing protein [Bacteroidia bacterium]
MIDPRQELIHVNKARALLEKEHMEELMELCKKEFSNYKEIDEFRGLFSQHFNLMKPGNTLTIPRKEKDINLNKIRFGLLNLFTQIEKEAKKDLKVLISYKGEEGEESAVLVKDLGSEIERAGFTVYWDRKPNLSPGSDSYLIKDKFIAECSYLILLLSKKANNSEVVIDEVNKVVARKGSSLHSPIIIPIRVSFLEEEELLNPKFFKWLENLKPFHWLHKGDSKDLFKEVFSILDGREEVIQDLDYWKSLERQMGGLKSSRPSPVAPLEIPKGNVGIDSKYYVIRKGESEFIKKIELPSALLRIRAPRQFGKTSLLNRIIAHANLNDFVVVPIDFQQLSSKRTNDLDALVSDFLKVIAIELDIEEKLKARLDRKSDSGIGLRCKQFLEKDILDNSDKPLLLAMDEVDTLFGTEASSDFFALLRHLHEVGSQKETFKRLKMVLTYATTKGLLIQQNRSPFNVGLERKLLPFTLEEQEDLVKRHALSEIIYEDRVVDFDATFGGYPYLVRMALYLIADKGSDYDFELLMSTAAKATGPFEDHLRHLANLFNGLEEKYVEGFKSLMNGGTLHGRAGYEVYEFLRGIGLIKGDFGESKPACTLYTVFFKKIL